MKNKGWFVAEAELTIRDGVTGNELQRTSHNIWSPFFAHFYSNHKNVTYHLEVAAAAGKNIVSFDFQNPTRCFVVYGTTLFPAWNEFECW